MKVIASDCLCITQGYQNDCLDAITTIISNGTALTFDITQIFSQLYKHYLYVCKLGIY